MFVGHDQAWIKEGSILRVWLSVQQRHYGELLAGPQAAISVTTKEPNTAVMATIAKLKAASDEVRTAASAAKLNEVFGSGGAGAPRRLAPPVVAVAVVQPTPAKKT
jgi:hypothetical protein